MRLALSTSRQSALAAALGVALAALTYAAAGMFGVGVLLQKFPSLTQAMQVLGGGCLITMGLMMWRSGKTMPAHESACQRRQPAAWSVATGLTSGLANPKAMIFFLGLFAAAIPASAGLGEKLAVLVAGASIELAWYSSAAFILSASASRAWYVRARQTLDRIFGTVLILLGLVLLFGWRASLQ